MDAEIAIRSISSTTTYQKFWSTLTVSSSRAWNRFIPFSGSISSYSRTTVCFWERANATTTKAIIFCWKISTWDMLCMHSTWQTTRWKMIILIWCVRETCACRWSCSGTSPLSNRHYFYRIRQRHRTGSLNWIAIWTFCWTLACSLNMRMDEIAKALCNMKLFWRRVQCEHTANTSVRHTNMQLGSVWPTRYALGGNVRRLEWNACGILRLVWLRAMQDDKYVSQ